MTENKEFAYTTRQIVESKDSIEYGPANQRIKIYFETAEEAKAKMTAMKIVMDSFFGTPATEAKP